MPAPGSGARIVGTMTDMTEQTPRPRHMRRTAPGTASRQLSDRQMSEQPALGEEDVRHLLDGWRAGILVFGPRPRQGTSAQVAFPGGTAYRPRELKSSPSLARPRRQGKFPAASAHSGKTVEAHRANIKRSFAQDRPPTHAPHRLWVEAVGWRPHQLPHSGVVRHDVAP